MLGHLIKYIYVEETVKSSNIIPTYLSSLDGILFVAKTRDVKGLTCLTITTLLQCESENQFIQESSFVL